MCVLLYLIGFINNCNLKFCVIYITHFHVFKFFFWRFTMFFLSCLVTLVWMVFSRFFPVQASIYEWYISHRLRSLPLVFQYITLKHKWLALLNFYGFSELCMNCASWEGMHLPCDPITQSQGTNPMREHGEWCNSKSVKSQCCPPQPDKARSVTIMHGDRVSWGNQATSFVALLF